MEKEQLMAKNEPKMLHNMVIMELDTNESLGHQTENGLELISLMVSMTILHDLHQMDYD